METNTIYIICIAQTIKTFNILLYITSIIFSYLGEFNNEFKARKKQNAVIQNIGDILLNRVSIN